MDLKPSDYFELDHIDHVQLFESAQYVWDPIKQIASYLQFRLKPNIEASVIGKPFISDEVYVGEGTIIEPGAFIRGPAWIGKNCIVRHGAYIRENVIVGNNCVLGNSCEFKNSLLLNHVEVPHFSYVGDSILGNKAHLGAGVICSNLRLDRREVVIGHGNEKIETGLRKFGAIVGDGTEVGCNSVLNPGSILGKQTLMAPGTIWKGIAKANQVIR
ncbi:MAG: UDP-N-acetylglucosamine diphosphorylase [Verrucomicrobiota bacterium]